MVIDGKLIKKAQNGDIEAFGEIFRQMNIPIYNFLLNLSSDRELAADLRQETFIRAFKALKSLKRRDSFVPWLHRIALNIYRNEIKKKRLYTESIDQNSSADDFDSGSMEIEDWVNNPDRIITDKESQGILRDAIQSLPEIHRTAVIMHHIEGMEINEIAQTLQVKDGTVMSRLARARETLRRKLAFYIGDKL